MGRTRRATAIGATAFVLAGWAVLAMPATASAETKTVPCGSTVTAKPGDRIVGTTLLGLPLDLGVVSDGIGQLLNGLCTVTVNVVDTVVSPVPGVGAPVAGAVGGAVSGTTNGLAGAANQAAGALSGSAGRQPGPQQPAPGSSGNPLPPPSAPRDETAGSSLIPKPNSPVLGGVPATPNFGGLPFGSTTGYAPMRDYSNIPMVNAGLYSPSPGVRYGGQIPGYAPQFGILGRDSVKSANTGVQNAGRAEALPGGGVSDGVGLPVLIAVLALSGVSAGLVRTWVLRRMAATA